MKATEKAAIIKAGRAELRKWLETAEKHGTIYYEVTRVARSGMSRRIVLQTIRMRKGKPELVKLWPSLPDAEFSTWALRSEATDIVARDWGFSFKHRAFVIGGCGMDMVFALVDHLASAARVEGRGKDSYANKVRRESFS